MIHINRIPMTAVPTELLLNPELSTEAKAAAAILYTFDDRNRSTLELAAVLNTPEEKVQQVFSELAEAGYLNIRKDGNVFILDLKLWLEEGGF